MLEKSIDALGVHVEAQGHEIDVAGTLAVAEQAALDAIGAGHVAELGRCDAGAAVVVRMQAENDRIAVLEVAMAPFDLVGVDVGRGHLDRRRQVDDHLLLRRRLVDVADRGADVARELELGAGEALRRILVDPLGVGIGIGQLLDQLGAGDGDVDDAVIVEAEHDPPLQRLHQHLDGDVVRDRALLDERAHEVEVGLRGGGEADLDLLEAHLAQEAEHASLAIRVHRLDQGLVAVPEVDRAPDRRLGDDLGRPLSVGEGNGPEGNVLLARVRHHRFLG